jgi:hypothetical protein
MTLFIIGLIIFCCGIICRLIIFYAEKQNNENKYKIEINSETKTKRFGVNVSLSHP